MPLLGIANGHHFQVQGDGCPLWAQPGPWPLGLRDAQDMWRRQQSRGHIQSHPAYDLPPPKAHTDVSRITPTLPFISGDITCAFSDH